MDIRESIKELDKYKGHELIDLTRLRHSFMTTYGWISEKEFYIESSVEEIIKLSNYIALDEKKKQDELDKIKNKSK